MPPSMPQVLADRATTALAARGDPDAATSMATYMKTEMPFHGVKKAGRTTVLFTFSLRRAHEDEFFIRKAIGWALRQYARVAPDAVRAFVLDHRDAWSGLTFREATKHLDV